MTGAIFRGIFVMTEARTASRLAVTAEKGTFLATDDPDTIILRLANGVLVHDAPNYQSPRVLSFTGHDLPIDLPKIEAFRSRGGKDRERTMPELVQVGNDAAPARIDCAMKASPISISGWSKWR
jgi:lipopolysaccharide export system permease protein